MASLQSYLFRQYVKWESSRTDRGSNIQEQRQAMENAAKMMSLPGSVTIQAETVNGLYTEWLTPENEISDSVILYLHGGGYAIGSVNTHRAMVARIAKASRTKAWLIDYRLAPEYPFPAALDDATGAYQHLLNSGYSHEQIILMGESAGGGLVLSTMICLRDTGIALPAAAVVMSPFTDLTASGESISSRLHRDPMNKPEDIVITNHYVGNHNPAHPLLSPLFADLSGLPPLYIQVGDDEIMLSDSTRLVEKAKQSGIEVEIEIWEKMWHVWQFFAPYMPEANRAIKKIGNFVQQSVH